METINIADYLHPLDFAVLGGYLLVIIGLGYYYSFVGGQRGEDEELFLAGRKLNWSSIGFTMWGTNVGPSMLIASCGVGYTTGIVAGNFSWYAFPFIYLLARVFAPFYRMTKVSTLPEFMGKRFGADTRILLACYSLATILFSWLGLTLYAGGLLMSQITEWPLWISVVTLVVLSAFFAIAGGLEAIAKTNVFQMLLLLVVSAIIVGVGIYQVGGPGKMIAQVPSDRWDLLLPLDNPDYPWLAILLGYPVLGIWFWCTDQSMVQSVLGAKTLRQGQLGTNLTAWLKILDVPLFILPGILCFVLFPGLEDENEAYMTMVTQLLPTGLVGLVMAVLIAALISTINSALNSLGAVFTVDVLARMSDRAYSQKELNRIGRLVILVGAVLSIFVALACNAVKDYDLFSLFQAILGYLAPPMAAVFLVGVLWPRMTTRAANIGIVVGSLTSLIVGVMQLSNWPDAEVWPHFLYVSFGLFVFICALITIVTLLDDSVPEGQLSLAAVDTEQSRRNFPTAPWAILAVVMLALYVWLA